MSRLPTTGSGSLRCDWVTPVTATTLRPRRRAPRAISTGTAVSPLALKTIITSSWPEAEVAEDDLGQSGHALDEHGLLLTVRADHLGVERHRQLHDGIEAREAAVAREHLLDRDARVAGAEEVHQPVRGDGVRAEPRDRSMGSRWVVADASQQCLGLAEPIKPAFTLAAVRRVGHRMNGRSWSRATRKPRLTFSSVPSKTRSSCSMMTGRRSQRDTAR